MLRLLPDCAVAIIFYIIVLRDRLEGQELGCEAPYGASEHLCSDYPDPIIIFIMMNQTEDV